MRPSSRPRLRGAVVPLLAFPLLVVVAAACASLTGDRGRFRTDHFKFYEAKIVDRLSFAPQSVELRGQFDRGRVPHIAQLPTRFGVAVDKNGEGVIDRQAHLTWYPLERTEEPIRKVQVKNQFGLVTVKLGNPVALLVPTQKVEKGSADPRDLSHFKVYEILEVDRFSAVPVTLQDQFDDEPVDTRLQRPTFFAVPVSKRNLSGGRADETPLRNEGDHLLVYPIGPLPDQQEREILNQFDTRRRTLEIGDAVLLAVPSTKGFVEEGAVGK